MKKFRVTLFNCMGEIERRTYTDDVEAAKRAKLRHGPDFAMIMMWAGKKNGWQIASENSVT